MGLQLAYRAGYILLSELTRMTEPFFLFLGIALFINAWEDHHNQKKPGTAKAFFSFLAFVGWFLFAFSMFLSFIH